MEVRNANEAGRVRLRLPGPALSVFALSVFILWTWCPALQRVDAAASASVEQKAVALMADAIRVVAEARQSAAGPIDRAVDPDGTGLIGDEWSIITTTLGDLRAKRTATNPLWAAYVVRKMREAGVNPGDVVWATLSGSFPGFNLAVLAAAQAMGVRLYAASSLSSSTWGANLPEFTWLDMEGAARRAGLFNQGTAAVFLGGHQDRGPDLFSLLAGDPDAGVAALRAAAARHPWPLLEPANLAEAVAMRLHALAQASGVRRPKLHINAGGPHAALGDCVEPWPSGLTTGAQPCTGGEPGFLHAMAAAGVPVLHLLDARTLAAEAGIPFDGRFTLEESFDFGSHSGHSDRAVPDASFDIGPER